MKRLVLGLGLCALLSACNLLRGGLGSPGGGPQCPAPSTLPSLQPYKPGSPLPLRGATHLVAGLCLSEPARVVVYGVDARGCAITFRVSASEPTTVQALLAQSQRSGLPLTLFSAPVAPVRGSTTPVVDPCDLTKGSQQGSDVPTGGGGPVAGRPPEGELAQGSTPSEGVTTLEEPTQVQLDFGRVAVEAARALSSAVDASAKATPRE